jgi:large subunit ribosomal protein L18
MAIKNKKVQRRNSIRQRIRKIIKGSADRPRMTVYRSNQQIYVQLVDDNTGRTLVAAGSLDKSGSVAKTNKIEQAKEIGKLIAEKALAAGIENVVFDRNGYLYHGRVKSLAEAAREGGLKF